MKRILTALILIALINSLPVGYTFGAQAPAAFTKHCLSCHGNDGKGRTKAGRQAKVKDLTDAAYQASFTDEQAAKSIKEGMSENGKEKMKAFGKELSDDEIKTLVAFIRTFKK